MPQRHEVGEGLAVTGPLEHGEALAAQFLLELFEESAFLRFHLPHEGGRLPEVALAREPSGGYHW